MSSPRETSQIHVELTSTSSSISSVSDGIATMEPGGSDSPMETATAMAYQQHEEIEQTGCNAFVTDPDHKLIRLWDCLVTCSIVVTCVLGLFMATLDSSSVSMWVIVYLVDVINIADIIHRFFLSYKDKRGIPIDDRKEILKNYLRTGFGPDLLSVAPFEGSLVFMHHVSSVTQMLSLCRLNRLLRFWRVLRFFEDREDELGSNTAALRSMKYSIICLLSTHTLSCCWFAVACVGIHAPDAHIACHSNSWPDNSYFSIGFNMSSVHSTEAYLVSLYWAVATATSTGYGDISAVNQTEMLFSTGAMLFGIAVFFGMLLGGMTSMLTNFDQQRADFVHRFENIKEHMKEENVPDDLQRQVIGYYEYFWARKKGVQMDGVYNNLPLTFQAEICHSTNKEILQKAPIFQNMGTGFLRMLSMRIQYQLCLPTQLIVTRGEIGHQMFFIHKGEVEVLSEEDDDTPVATLKAGKIFGEVSLIYSLPRIATIRAKTHCDLMVLNREDMQAILLHYPEVLDRLQETAKRRCKNAIDTPREPRLKTNTNIKAAHVKRETIVSEAHTGRRKSFVPSEADKTHGLHVHKKQATVTMSASVELIETEDAEAIDKADDVQSSVGCCRRMSEFIKYSTIDPNGDIARWWHYIIISVTVFISVCYPYMACYTSPTSRYGYFQSVGGLCLLVFTYICDLILVIDILVNLRMEVVTEHETLEDFKDIVRHYCHSVHFVVDLLAIAPLECCCIFVPHASMHTIFIWLRLNRLVKFFEIPKMFASLEESLNSNIEKVRCMKFVLYICLLTHWVSCALFAMACSGDHCLTESWFGVWAADTFSNGTHSEPMTDYIVSLYMASATMTSTGYGDLSGHTVSGRFIALLAMLLGLLLYGYALAAMAATLTTGDTNRVHYQERLLAIKAFMKERHLDEEIQKRVVDYLCILWEKHKGVWVPGMPPLMHDVPIALQQDIAVEDAYHTLALCPLFKDTDEAFLRTLAVKTQTFLFRPNEIIVYAGDMSFEMYCIRQGYCEIRTPDMKYLLCQIGPGQYFGEVGMLFEEYRDTSVMAGTSVEVLEIKFSDLKDVLKDFPLVKSQFDVMLKNKEAYVERHNALYEQYPSLKQNKTVSESDLARKSEQVLKDHEETFVRDAFKAKGLVSFYKCSPEVKEEFDEGFKEMPMYGRILSSILMKAALNPMNKDLKICSGFIMLTAVAQGFFIPVHAAFFPRNTNMLIGSYVLDFGHFFNMYVRSHLAYFNDKDVVFVTHPIYTAHNYMYTNFVVDLMGTLPYELLILTAGVHTFIDYLPIICILRMNRLFHLYRVPLAANHVEGSVARTTGSVRAGKFFLYTALFLNFITCITYLVACPPYVGPVPPASFDNSTGLVAGSWIYNTLSANNVNLTEAVQSVTSLYALAFYWATATAVSVGYGDISANLPYEMVFSLVIMVMGVLFFGYIIASVAAGMANADTQRAIFADKIRSIKTYMEDQNIPESLRDRVMSYYNHLYIRTKGINPKSLFDALPSSLWGDLSLGMYENIIGEISLFKDTDVSFMKMLCKTIQPALYLKGEFIVRKHDIGKEMFFIHRGIVDVVSEDGNIVFDTMTVGQAFGEVALLFQCPRTAAIRARTNCDLFILNKTDLDMALVCYPDVKEKMLTIAEERRNQARQRSLANAMRSMDKLTPDERRDLETTFMMPPSETGLTDDNHNQNNPGSIGSDPEEESSIEQMEMEVETKQPGLIGKLKEKNRFTIDPKNNYLRYYSNFMCVLGILSSFLVVFQAAFQEHHIAIIIMNYICDFFFIIHIYIKFHCCYYTEEGDLVDDFDLAFKRYVKTKSGFLRDFLGTVPFEIVAIAFPHQLQLHYLSMLRMPRLLRVFSVTDYFHNWEKELEINMLAVRLCQNLVTLGLGMHSLSSMWFVLACPPWEHGHCHAGSWIEFSRSSLHSTLDKYVTCLYWCTATMTSTGYGDEHAYLKLEMGFAAVVMIFGKLMFGFILGNIASTLQNAEANRVQYDERLTGIKNNMEDQHVPKTLRHRVISYFGHLWLRTKGVEIQSMFEDCPRCLLAEVSLTITRPMLETIPLFEGADESFLRQVCLKIKQILFLPNDCIIRKGDVGNGLLYIHRGEVEIISEDDTPIVMDIMKEGQIFGEVSLIANIPRRVTARARTHVDVLCLTKEDLDEVLHHYPVLEARMNEAAKARFGTLLKEFAQRYSITPDT